MPETLDRQRAGRPAQVSEQIIEQKSGGQSPPPSTASWAAEANFRYRWLILAALILAAAMEVLDTTIINVALPQMAGNLSTTIQEIAWVSTGYILSNVVVLPMTAFLNTLFGRRNYLVGSIVLFTVASFFCGTSHSLGGLIVWRILQGAGGAALISTAQATLVQVFSPKEQAVVQPVFLMGLVVFPTLGPTLGGWITDAANWNWCFFINIPIGLLAGGLVFFLLHDTEPARRDEPVDWAGIGLMATGLASLQYVLEEGEQDDWFSSASIVRLSVLSAITLAAFVAWQLSPRNTHPIVDFRVLRNGSLSAGIGLFIAVGFGLYGVISSSPKSPLDARLLTLLGIMLSMTGMWGLAHLNAQSSVSDTFWPLIIRGFSVGFLFVPVNQLAIGSLKPAQVNQSVALLGLARQLGGSIGIAILATFLQSQQHINRANLVGYLTPTRPAYAERVSGLAGTLTAHGYSHADAQAGALGVIEQVITRQASALSFNGSFLLLMGISAAMLLTLLLLRKSKPGAAPAAMH